MRKQFVRTTEEIMTKDPRLVLLPGDIGVFGFRNAFQRHPERTYNIGICEQAMTSLAAGLAKEGFIPVLHSIAPFVVERSFEQLKVDLCYQNLPAKIVSVGGSYDYAGLGCTHHCPGDVAVLRACRLSFPERPRSSISCFALPTRTLSQPIFASVNGATGKRLEWNSEGRRLCGAECGEL